jgi:phytoene dehydrogenase-like protein
LGGELLLHRNVSRISELPSARAYLFDISPTALISIAEGRLSGCYERRLARFRYGPGVFKVDWALREPIPWRAPECRQSITVHLAGDLEQIAAAIRAAREGRMAERPFVLLAQPSLVDPSRAPQGKHTAWAYCHVPHGDSTNVLDAIEAQIERHAPGFREVILARSTRNAIEMEHYDPNYVGGDINAGSSDLKQLFFRPVAKLDPYATSAADIFLCSSSTPPGGGVHGMCGYWAAQSALKKRFGREALSIATEARAWPQVS